MQAALFIHSDKLRWIRADRSSGFADVGQVEFPRGRLLSECLHDAFSQFGELRQAFDSVRIVWMTPYTLLLPLGLLSDEAALAGARRLLPRFSNLSLQEDRLADAGIHNIYQVDKGCLGELSARYRDAQHMHVHSLLIRTYSLQLANSALPVIYLHFDSRQLHVVAFRDGRLKLAASYRFVNGKDLLYYALLALKYIKAEQSDTFLRLSGAIESGSLYFNMLAQYFPLLEILKEPLAHYHEHVSAGNYLHYHFDLYAALCE